MNKFQKLDIFVSKLNSIFSNLSIERHIYKNYEIKNPILLFYQNDKSVIIGRNQNPWKECRLGEIEKRNIQLCRRNSGGGAVYQDLGNLCFSFITPVFQNILPLDMKNFHNKILIQGFKNIGLDVEEQGRNDLLVNGKKFSGSAFEVDLGGRTKIQKVLHHGTILMDTDFSVMQHILNPNILKMKSKGIDSVKARVINLKDLKKDINADEIINGITQAFIQNFAEQQTEINNQIIDDQFIDQNPEIQVNIKQMQDKNWVLGQCPQFSNEFTEKLSFGLLNINIDVNKGIITQVKIFSDSLFPDFIDKCNEIFQYNKFEYSIDGIQEFESKIKNENNQNWNSMIEELCQYLKKCIKNDD